MQKCDFNFLEITLLHGYSFVIILHICSRMHFFREHIWGTASLYCSKYINIVVLSKQVKKLFEIDLNIVNAFSTLTISTLFNFNFAENVIRPWLPSSIYEGRIYASLVFKGILQVGLRK